MFAVNYSSQSRAVLSYFSLLLRKVWFKKSGTHYLNRNLMKIRLQLSGLHAPSCCMALFWSLSWGKKWYHKTWPSALNFRFWWWLLLKWWSSVGVMHCVVVKYSIVLEECTVSVFRVTELVVVQRALYHTHGGCCKCLAVSGWGCLQQDVAGQRFFQEAAQPSWYYVLIALCWHIWTCWGWT